MFFKKINFIFGNLIEVFEKENQDFFKENFEKLKGKIGRVFKHMSVNNNAIKGGYESGFVSSSLQNLSFSNGLKYFSGIGIFDIFPLLVFDFESENFERQINLLKMDYLCYYRKQLKGRNPFLLYLKNKYRSLIKLLMEQENMGLIIPKESFLSEIFFILLKKDYPKLIEKFELKNSNVKESIKYRLKWIALMENTHKNHAKILQNKLIGNALKFGLNDFE